MLILLRLFMYENFLKIEGVRDKERYHLNLFTLRD